MANFEFFCERSLEVSQRVYEDIAEQARNPDVYIRIFPSPYPNRVRFMLQSSHVESDDTIRETRDELITQLRMLDPSARIWGVDPSTKKLHLL